MRRTAVAAGMTVTCVAGLMGAAGVSSAAAAHNTTTANAPTVVRVATFNVNNGAASGLGAGGARMDRITTEIRRTGADVVGLQETATAMRDQLASRLHPTHTYSLLGDSKGRNNTGGQIFYRPDVLRPGTLTGIISLPGHTGRSRSGLYQDFYHQQTGTHLLFASVHLSNGDGRAASDVRATQTQHLMAALTSVNTAKLPLIVAGDMNSNRAHKYVYDAPRQTFTAYGFSDVFTRATSTSNAAFNTFNRLERIPRKGGYRPDQIYVPATVGVTDASTLVRTVRKKVRSGTKTKRKTRFVLRYRTPFVSDHNPVAATVTLP